ncbi:hypothetical protein L226DRAFT_383211 [Lentinus tigrinus ALCF2SS1-7]|uniref:uncharacterized protein n=1 Tax=Lentinus tigrinus ALCF2SS1-7 TaxID=1328758 RepID=UPI001165D85D|nr:hypothetical protein L226DRAFT_383211 [Lentinus tigrinus ALCF2SS1-7]
MLLTAYCLRVVDNGRTSEVHTQQISPRPHPWRRNLNHARTVGPHDPNSRSIGPGQLALATRKCRSASVHRVSGFQATTVLRVTGTCKSWAAPCSFFPPSRPRPATAPLPGATPPHSGPALPALSARVLALHVSVPFRTRPNALTRVYSPGREQWSAPRARGEKSWMIMGKLRPSVGPWLRRACSHQFQASSPCSGRPVESKRDKGQIPQFALCAY